MTYDVEKLMLEARKLAVNFRQATGKPLGISNEIAVHDVIRLMHLEAVTAGGNGGYDAIGTGERAGKRIQIKGRSVSSESKSSQRIGQIKQDKEWDSIMLILLDDAYEPLEIYEADRQPIMEVVIQTSHKRRNRGALSLARFQKIGKLVWRDENKVAKPSQSALSNDPSN